jgi:ABC-type multidrug transport system ATPase subunit/peptidoglycan/LPS O-acetylase OafA/YrhL
MSNSDRLHALDAVRAAALLLGVVFHAGFSFIPGMITGLWAFADTSPSTSISVLLFVSHIFRMTLFFFLAGFFARLLFHRRGARGFWADRAKRILVPMLVGWVVLFPAIAAVWVWGISKAYAGSPPPLPENLPPPPAAAFPMTHLWFLYYLLVLYALTLAIRAIVVRFDSAARIRCVVDAMVGGLVRSGAPAVLLALPLAVSLYLRADWISWFGVPTPDRSVIPEWASLIGFGTALGFGWLVHRQVDLLQVWARQWPAHFGVAAVTTVACLGMVGLTPTLSPVAPGLTRLAYASCYTVAVWSWVFAITGSAVRFLSGERPLVRYVADSSYWIYLAHLPVVAALQVLVGDLPWHWTVKFPLILAVSFTLLFASYHLLVRSTAIGAVLNGRRYPRKRASDPVHQGPDPGGPGGETVAALKGVHHRYGRTPSLDGVDLEVRRGELVALLGPNGAGKSTAVSLWLGLLEPDAGSVTLMGGSPLDVESRRSVGVMMQEVALPPTLRVHEHLELAGSYYPDPLPAAEAMALTGTTALQRRPYGELSAGQKRQVQFAMAICGRPRLLFLDEPTVGLDLHAREAMWRTMRALVDRGCSILLTTHYLEEAEALADRVVVLAKGRAIAEGTVAEIRGVVSRKRITCASSLAVEAVSAWPGVLDARRESTRLHLTVSVAEPVVHALLEADPALHDLEVRQTGLSDAFSELTKEAA